MSVEHGEGFVRIGLMKTAEGDGIVALVRRSNPAVTVTDRGAYWVLEAAGELTVDAEELSDELGEDVTVEDILVTFASYAGRAEIDGDVVRVTSQFPQMGMEHEGARAGG
ncbi:MAG: MmoB/DmpM family protein [Actinomycetota bacterium]|jgi:hypothetical protein